MLIPITCSCGRSFQVKEERVGQVGKCPSCGSKVVISFSTSDYSSQDLSFPADLIDTSEPEKKPNPGDFLVTETASIALEDLKDFAQENSVDEVDDSASEEIEIEEERPMKQYKVLTQKDKWFTAKFDPEMLERAINAYAQQGWVVKAMTTASIPGFGGNREELIILLER